jgi:SIR2-like domain
MNVLHPPWDFAERCYATLHRHRLHSNDYDRVIGRDSNAWNQSMKSVLAGSTPLFLGLSGDDQRLRAVLDEVKWIRPATQEKHRYWAARPTVDSESAANVDRWRALGVAPGKLASYDEIPNWLLSICQRSAAGLSK